MLLCSKVELALPLTCHLRLCEGPLMVDYNHLGAMVFQASSIWLLIPAVRIKCCLITLRDWTDIRTCGCSFTFSRIFAN